MLDNFSTLWSRAIECSLGGSCFRSTGLEAVAGVTIVAGHERTHRFTVIREGITIESESWGWRSNETSSILDCGMHIFDGKALRLVWSRSCGYPFRISDEAPAIKRFEISRVPVDLFDVPVFDRTDHMQFVANLLTASNREVPVLAVTLFGYTSGNLRFETFKVAIQYKVNYACESVSTISGRCAAGYYVHCADKCSREVVDVYAAGTVSRNDT